MLCYYVVNCHGCIKNLSLLKVKEPVTGTFFLDLS
jgi:hypothetical protein